MTNNNKDIPYINRRNVAFVIPCMWKERGEGGRIERKNRNKNGHDGKG
jgi:hypothetical protein